jgi:hypothetical protein
MSVVPVQGGTAGLVAVVDSDGKPRVEPVVAIVHPQDGRCHACNNRLRAASFRPNSANLTAIDCTYCQTEIAHTELGLVKAEPGPHQYSAECRERRAAGRQT